MLDLYTPALKGLHHVHSYICERLESLVFDSDLGLEQLLPIAYLYGQAMALSPTTAEGAALAVDNLLLRGESFSGELVLCILLGVERSGPHIFESSLTVLLRQTQASAFSSLVSKLNRTVLIFRIVVSLKKLCCVQWQSTPQRKRPALVAISWRPLMRCLLPRLPFAIRSRKRPKGSPGLVLSLKILPWCVDLMNLTYVRDSV